METFDCSKNYILEDASVLLRPLETNDTDHLKTFSVHEPEIWKYSLVPAAGEEQLSRYIRVALEARAEQKEYPFIVYDKVQEQFAGSTRFYDIQVQNKSIQLGYTWYGKKFQGTGLNKHCKFLMLQFAFEKMGMERVEFRADNNNAKSIAAMKSVGCSVEGVLRSNVIKTDGTRRDSIVLSILKNEWQDHVKENLLKKIQ